MYVLLEGCTSFVFFTEHRRSAHGPTRHSTAVSTAFHGQSRTLHGLPRTFHGLPRNAAASSATPWRPMALAIWQFSRQGTRQGTRQSPRQSPRQPTASTHGIPRQAAVQRKDPRQCPRYGGDHGICRGSCRGTSVSCHGWYHGGCHGQNRGTCHGHNSGSAMCNGKPWPLPWKPADFHGSSPWKDPRKTTEVPRSLPRTSTKKLNNVHLWKVGDGGQRKGAAACRFKDQLQSEGSY